MPDVANDLFDLAYNPDAESVISLVESGSIVIPGPGVLQGLPQDWQWEHQRRHPYFILLRLQANLYRQYLRTIPGGGNQRWGFVPADEREEMATSYAHQVISNLGMNGYLPSPRKSWAEVQTAMDDGRVAARRTSRFEFLVELMRDIDCQHADVISDLLQAAALKNASGTKPSRADHRLDAFAKLTGWLGQGTSDEFLTINRFAQKEEVLANTKESYERLREEMNVEQSRVHKSKIQRNLRVWDLREGWADGTYDVLHEMSLKDITQTPDAPGTISSVENAYKAAFLQIIGVEYSPEAWFQTIGFFKLHTSGLGALSAMRPQKTKSRREVPESKVGIDLEVAQPSSSSVFEVLTDYKLDLLELKSRGRSNSDIAAEMGMTPIQVATFFSLHDRGAI